MGSDRAPATRATKNSQPAIRTILVAVLAASVISACTPTTRVVGGGAGPILGPQIRLSPGTVKADLTVVGDASQILRESAVDSLSAAGMTCPQGTQCPTIDLQARMVESAATFAPAQPPIRVVELIASYHGGGSLNSSSTMSYQRTVAVNGNMSTATWMRISDALMTNLADDFSFRSQHSGIVVRLPSWASVPTNLTKTPTARAFHVAITSDGRSDPYAIGNVGETEVRLARRATDYIAEMLTDELRGSGHTIVPAKDGRLVGSQLETFWISSVSASFGWDTTAEIEVALEVGPPPGVKRKKAEYHVCSVSEHTSSRPTEPDLARVLQACLTQLVQSIRSDSVWSLGDDVAAAAP